MTSHPTRVLILTGAADTARRLVGWVEQSAPGEFSAEGAGPLDAGLARLKNGGADVVVLDLDVADGEGIDTFLKVFGQAPDLPLLVLVAPGDETLGMGAVHCGAHDYLSRDELDDSTFLHALRGAVRDRHRENRLQREQRRKAEELVHRAANAAHDLNNLLHIILGCAEVLLGRSDGNVETRSLVGEIKNAGGRAAVVARQLLHFGRRGTGPTQGPVDLNALLTEVDPLLRRVLGAGIQMVQVWDPALPPIQGDAFQLEQLMVRLALHARLALPHGGQFVVEASVCPANGEQAAHALLTVTLTGETGEGSPLAATARQGPANENERSALDATVRQCGGHVEVDQLPGQGTHFRFRFPLVAPSAQEGADAPVLRSAIGGAETILLVEDEPALRALLALILRTNGYRVLVAEDAGEAMLVAHEHGGPLNLLLSDVALPQMSGRQLAESLAPLHPEMCVLYMSGRSAEEVGELRPSGASFMQKPFEIDELLSRLRVVLDDARPAGAK